MVDGLRSAKVAVPMAALQVIMSKLGQLQDEGPAPNGWQSNELQSAIADVQTALRHAGHAAEFDI